MGSDPQDLKRKLEEGVKQALYDDFGAAIHAKFLSRFLNMKE